MLIFSKKSLFFWIGLTTLILFVGFSYLVHRNLFTHLDFDSTVRLQDHISRHFDSLFSLLSDIGKFEIITIVLFVASFWYTIAHKKWLLTFVAFFFYGLMHFIEIYGKTFVHHLPPPHFLLRTHDVFIFPQFYVQQTNSYPSGHAGRALFLTIFFGLISYRSQKLKRKHKLLIYLIMAIYDITMLISRIYLGEHWLSDVIGGSILGTAMGFLVGIFI